MRLILGKTKCDGSRREACYKMPLFNYKCKCGMTRRVMVDLEPDSMLCKCGLQMDRNYGAVSSQQTEVLDNGWMPRRIERLAKAEDLHHDYAKSKEDKE